MRVLFQRLPEMRASVAPSKPLRDPAQYQKRKAGAILAAGGDPTEAERELDAAPNLPIPYLSYALAINPESDLERADREAEAAEIDRQFRLIQPIESRVTQPTATADSSSSSKRQKPNPTDTDNSTEDKSAAAALSGDEVVEEVQYLLCTLPCEPGDDTLLYAKKLSITVCRTPATQLQRPARHPYPITALICS